MEPNLPAFLYAGDQTLYTVQLIFGSQKLDIFEPTSGNIVQSLYYLNSQISRDLNTQTLMRIKSQGKAFIIFSPYRDMIVQQIAAAMARSRLPSEIKVPVIHDLGQKLLVLGDSEITLVNQLQKVELRIGYADAEATLDSGILTLAGDPNVVCDVVERTAEHLVLSTIRARKHLIKTVKVVQEISADSFEELEPFEPVRQTAFKPVQRPYNFGFLQSQVTEKSLVSSSPKVSTKFPEVKSTVVDQSVNLFGQKPILLSSQKTLPTAIKFEEKPIAQKAVPNISKMEEIPLQKPVKASTMLAAPLERPASQSIVPKTDNNDDAFIEQQELEDMQILFSGAAEVSKLATRQAREKEKFGAAFAHFAETFKRGEEMYRFDEKKKKFIRTNVYIPKRCSEEEIIIGWSDDLEEDVPDIEDVEVKKSIAAASYFIGIPAELDMSDKVEKALKKLPWVDVGNIFCIMSQFELEAVVIVARNGPAFEKALGLVLKKFEQVADEVVNDK